MKRSMPFLLLRLMQAVWLWSGPAVPDIASAAVRKYTVFQSSCYRFFLENSHGNAYVLTGEAQDVTRTTALFRERFFPGSVR